MWSSLPLTDFLDVEECPMNFHAVFVGRNTRVYPAVLKLGVGNVKGVFSYFTASLRERSWGRSGPFNFRSWVP